MFDRYFKFILVPIIFIFFFRILKLIIRLKLDSPPTPPPQAPLQNASQP